MSTAIVRKPPRFAQRAFEFRASDDMDHGDGRTLEGYAAVFGQPTEISSWEGDFEEDIAPGAFKRTIKARTPVMQFDHGHDWRTGSVPIASIDELSEDEHGLFVRARLFDNDLVAPIRDAIAGGAIDGMSFRFRVVDDIWRDKDGKVIKAGELVDLLWEPGDRGPIRRTIREVELFELGPVVFPAYDGTSVGVRSVFALQGAAAWLGMAPEELAAKLGVESGNEDSPQRAAANAATGEGDGDPSPAPTAVPDADDEDRSGSDESDDSKPARPVATRLYGEPAAEWHLPNPRTGTGGAFL